MGLTIQQTILEQDYHEVSASQQGILGTRAVTKDGREFRYTLAGAATLALGKVVQAPTLVANHQVVAVAAAVAAGATKITATLGATAATADQYKGGYVNITDSAGAGQALLIRGNSAAASSGVITLFLDNPVTTALTTGSKANLTRNQFDGAVIAATTTIDLILGVPQIAITAANYGWVQTRGISSVLVNGTPTVGAGVISSATTAGALDVEGTSAVTPRLGVIVNNAAVSTKYPVVNLSILN